MQRLNIESKAKVLGCREIRAGITQGGRACSAGPRGGLARCGVNGLHRASERARLKA